MVELYPRQKGILIISKRADDGELSMVDVMGVDWELHDKVVCLVLAWVYE